LKIIKRKTIVIWGASGQAKVVADIIRRVGEYEIAGFIDDINLERKDSEFCNSKILGGREVLNNLIKRKVRHIIIGFGDCVSRLKLSEEVLKLGFKLAKAVHPTACIAEDVVIGEGTVVAAGAVISPWSTIGRSVIINTGANVGHDCEIGDSAHIGPGVTLAGDVRIGKISWIGVGSVVRDKIRIGSNTMIGAGSLVLKDLPDNVIAYGTPAKIIRKNDS